MGKSAEKPQMREIPRRGRIVGTSAARDCLKQICRRYVFRFCVFQQRSLTAHCPLAASSASARDKCPAASPFDPIEIPLPVFSIAAHRPHPAFHPTRYRLLSSDPAACCCAVRQSCVSLTAAVSPASFHLGSRRAPLGQGPSRLLEIDDD